MQYESNRGASFGYIDLLCLGGVYPEERQPHQGIFKYCEGDFFTTEQTKGLETQILSEYAYRDVLFGPEQMAVEVGNIWNRYFSVLKTNVENQEEFTVEDETEKVTENLDGTRERSAESGTENKYSDTPNQYLENPETLNGLTSYSSLKGTGLSNDKIANTRTLETKKGHNRFERWLDLTRKNRNIIYDFIDRFNVLFQTTYIISGRI